MRGVSSEGRLISPKEIRRELWMGQALTGPLPLKSLQVNQNSCAALSSSWFRG